MEIHDKIYIERILCTNEVEDTWSPRRIFNDDIEYTRTDAFIEKACEWLRCNNNLHDGEIDDYVEEFRKYMKGE